MVVGECNMEGVQWAQRSRRYKDKVLVLAAGLGLGLLQSQEFIFLITF